MIRQLAKDGLDDEKIALYLRGSYDGMKVFRDHLESNKMEIKAGETDPLFVHTWNYVIDAMTEKIDTTIHAAFHIVEEGKDESGKGNPRSKKVDS